MTRSDPPSTAPRATPAASPRRTVLGAAAALALGAAAGPARAQAWPAGKPIRMVLPSGAGGGADIFGRFMAEWLGKELGTNVIVDNKPGANGLLATQEVARSAPDGYTLLISFTAATVANKLLMLKPPVDPISDITPIARIGGSGEAASMVAIGITPEITSGGICATVLYGTCTICMPVCCLIDSMTRWPPEPMPHDAYDRSFLVFA